MAKQGFRVSIIVMVDEACGEHQLDNMADMLEKSLDKTDYELGDKFGSAYQYMDIDIS